MVDLWVQNAQLWLNSHYTGVAGWTPVPEDGHTGWPTVNGIIRALQHELGITALSDSFGPMTYSQLNSQVGNISALTTQANIVALMQCGMWCKGYWGGVVFGDFLGDDDMPDELEIMNSEMGLSSVAALRPKAFKSLLTMDAYRLLSGGSSTVQAVQRWLNGTYVGRSDYYLVPCDGVFSRDVQRGLMLAIQYELGMADGVANGNFGPGTQSGLQAHGSFGVGTVDSTRKLVRLFQAALIFNGYDVPFSGYFDSATSAQTAAFQTFAALSATGSADFQTWASLLVSTGDPNRSGNASDTSTPLTATTGASLYAAGYRTVGRYLNGTGKGIKPGELSTIFSAGLRMFPIYQEWNNAAIYFTLETGRTQGRAAVRRARQLGLNAGTVIYFPVDYDPTGDEIAAVVLPYFQGVAEGVATSRGVPYQVGVYGTRNTCARVTDAGYAASSFVAGMSTGWSGNLGFRLPANWHYDQVQGLTIGSGTNAIQIDKDIQAPGAPSVGMAQVVPTPLRSVGTAVVYDDLFWWITELTHIAEEVTPFTTDDITRIRDDIVLMWLREPNYAGALWNTYAGRYPGDSPSVHPLIQQAHEDARALFTPRPATAQYPDLQHFAATATGYRRWGAPDAATSTCTVGELGGWALDLVTLWAKYEEARLGAGYSAGVGAWMSAHFGDASSVFSRADLIADVDAYLVERTRVTDSERSLSDIMREIIIGDIANSSARFEQFYETRFGASQATFKTVIKDIFTNPALWISAPVDVFSDGARRPGQLSGVGDPPPSVVAAELDDLANAVVGTYLSIMNA